MAYTNLYDLFEIYDQRGINKENFEFSFEFRENIDLQIFLWNFKTFWILFKINLEFWKLTEDLKTTSYEKAEGAIRSILETWSKRSLKSDN